MSDRNLTEPDIIVRTVTVIMAAVVGLTFLFGFGNVLNLALRLGVPGWVAPLVAPAVDLSVVGLLLGTRHLAVHGATPEQLRPARRLLIFSSLVALALNTADPILAGQFGKAAFDAVGPLLLIGWAEVGPALLAAITTTPATQPSTQDEPAVDNVNDQPTHQTVPTETDNVEHLELHHPQREGLLDRARQEDRHHWREHQRPISAETLRRRLRIGARTSRDLVATIRSEYDIGSEQTSERQHA
jgi:hypothetical protein